MSIRLFLMYIITFFSINITTFSLGKNYQNEQKLKSINKIKTKEPPPSYISKKRFIPYSIIRDKHFVIIDGHVRFPSLGAKIRVNKRTEGLSDRHQILESELTRPAIMKVSALLAANITSQAIQSDGSNLMMPQFFKSKATKDISDRKINSKTENPHINFMLTEVILTAFFDRVGSTLLTTTSSDKPSGYVTTFQGGLFHVLLKEQTPADRIIESLIKRYTIYAGFQDIKDPSQITIGEHVLHKGSEVGNQLFYAGKFIVSLLSDCMFNGFKILTMQNNRKNQISEIETATLTSIDFLLNRLWNMFKSASYQTFLRVSDPILKLNPVINIPGKEPIAIINLQGTFRWVFAKNRTIKKATEIQSKSPDTQEKGPEPQPHGQKASERKSLC